MNTPVIPVHNLAAKSLERADFEIVALDGKEDYDGDVPHRHNFFELMFFTQGGGKHEIDFKEFAIAQNTIHLISPTQVHKLTSTSARGFVICFKEEFAPLHPGHSFRDVFRFFDFTQYSPILEPDPDFFNELMELVHNLDLNFERHSNIKRDILGAYLNILLLKIKDYFIEYKISEKNSISSSNPKIQEFRNLIDKHYIEHFTVTEYSEKLNISANYLNALCKKETGKTAIGLIQERLVLEAKRVLYSTHLNVKEIAHLLHFDTDAYFVRFFKKHSGQTPLDYRNKQG